MLLELLMPDMSGVDATFIAALDYRVPGCVKSERNVELRNHVKIAALQHRAVTTSLRFRIVWAPPYPTNGNRACSEADVGTGGYRFWPNIHATTLITGGLA